MKTTHLDVGVFEMMLSKAKELAKKAEGSKMGPISDWFDAKNTCAILHVKQSTLKSLRASGKLPYSRIGGKIMYCQNDIQNLIGKQIVGTNI